MLSACGAMENRFSVERLQAKDLDSAATGAVILSVGAPERCMITSTFGHVIDVDTSRQVEVIAIDNHIIKSDFADHQGSVDVLVLNPGKYVIRPMLSGPYNHTYQTPEFGFSVVAGETTYIGELFMPTNCLLNTTFVIRDQYVRDLKMAGEKNPLIANRSVVKRLMILQDVWRATAVN
jgi:hypothetical protein